MQNKGNSQSKKITFFADVMLGRLAKWLRILGYDTAYNQSISSEELVNKARKQGRTILTRNKKVIKILSPTEHLFIEDDLLINQLKQVVKTFDLDLCGNLFTRCTQCNEAITLISKEEVKEEIPPFVYKNYEEFSKCLKCGKIFWPGTHLSRVEEVLKQLKTSLIS